MTQTNHETDALLEQARRLPHEITPNRDLWAGIESQLGAQLPAQETPPGAVPLRPRQTARSGSLRPRWQAAAMAASLLLALVIGYWVGQSDSPMPQPVAGAADLEINNLGPTAGMQSVSLTEEVGLQEARRNMAAQIEAGLVRLPADARFVVIENLTAINAALDEIDAVLARTPESGLDRQLLVAMYTDQLARLKSVQSLVLNSNQEILL
jgi:hypothetical protein